jgi:hypothetical protein
VGRIKGLKFQGRKKRGEGGGGDRKNRKVQERNGVGERETKSGEGNDLK